MAATKSKKRPVHVCVTITCGKQASPPESCVAYEPPSPVAVFVHGMMTWRTTSFVVEAQDRSGASARPASRASHRSPAVHPTGDLSRPSPRPSAATS
eukprot:CAMPEP_0171162398 /NCGR_PEP_ID=MMETSP0790-20130122/4571_1 /TAXON_ID=2925 /ORGANISM="Alexandrium catenella, Strain OF101" /LENGTH=96 /DNA_ID=CAMNT_0011626999 /DNA_START=33 /DNA_END=321 /DNA_ORIENTATION=-